MRCSDNIGNFLFRVDLFISSLVLKSSLGRKNKLWEFFVLRLVSSHVEVWEFGYFVIYEQTYEDIRDFLYFTLWSTVTQNIRILFFGKNIRNFSGRFYFCCFLGFGLESAPVYFSIYHYKMVKLSKNLYENYET